MRLIIEPDDGVAPLLTAIKGAKTSAEIVIFRFDHDELESALSSAAARGVKVQALIAAISRGDEENLRKLEMRFLEAGITVARTADDLSRYHDKLLIIDRRVLYALSFNYTRLDIDQSRGFGIITRNATLVQEAVKLFEADCQRTPYSPTVDTFIVSPANSRRTLTMFLKNAKEQLLIYDPEISDEDMIDILHDRSGAGVDVRIIGRVTERGQLSVRELAGLRLHTRTIICDGRRAAVGSQSLRSAELDGRREVGLIVSERRVVKRLMDTFEADWAAAETPVVGDSAANDTTTAEEVTEREATKKAVKIFVKELGPLTTTVRKAVKRAVANAGEAVLEDKTVKTSLKKVVKKAVKGAVNDAVNDLKKP
jgi:phosphatidylserine/phosphatidylglycerophosphate/cardiolipin synthase-like enzyme